MKFQDLVHVITNTVMCKSEATNERNNIETTVTKAVEGRYLQCRETHCGMTGYHNIIILLQKHSSPPKPQRFWLQTPSSYKCVY